MARKKKKAKPADHVDYDSSVDKTLVRPALAPAPNRYGAQAIYNEAGDQCCCHMVPLFESCDGCLALRETKRQPTLVGVAGSWVATLDDRVRENHGGTSDVLEKIDGKFADLDPGLVENDDFAEDGDDLDMYPEDV